jgi:integrase
VRRSLVENEGGKFELAEPKTAASRRTIDLTGYEVEALRRHRARLGAVPIGTRLVFTSATGRPILRSNFHRRQWRPILEACELPYLKFHGCRHTAATLALQAGVPVRIVQARLGHSKASTTLDVYQHAVPAMGRDAADTLEALIHG